MASRRALSVLATCAALVTSHDRLWRRVTTARPPPAGPAVAYGVCGVRRARARAPRAHMSRVWCLPGKRLQSDCGGWTVSDTPVHDV